MSAIQTTTVVPLHDPPRTPWFPSTAFTRQCLAGVAAWGIGYGVALLKRRSSR